MRIYLAGGWLGNLAPFWEEVGMKVHLAGIKGHRHIIEPRIMEEAMKIYLAGERTVKNGKDVNWHGIYILESYYYARDKQWITNLLKTLDKKDDFMLDSGAFTFMSDSNNVVDWDEYTENYAEYINKHDIELFVEMDIDFAVGLNKVEKLRNKLEGLTGKKPIPVWHRNRGKQYYLDMCKEYDYIALGGMVTGELTKDDIRYFPWFINEAHKQGTKIHALGFTGLKNLKRYNFDSVDSTAWLYGNRGGFLYHFNGTELTKIDKSKGTMLKSREVALHNFNEWVKFAKYMERYHTGRRIN